MKRLFIGMPVRNGARFVEDAIHSLRRQTFTDWKLLISDNASTDETPSICERFAMQDPRIQLIRQPADLGPYANFRAVLDQADGHYFMWAAADDRWLPEFAATCISNLDAHPSTGMAFTGIENVDALGSVVTRYRNLPSLSGGPDFRTVMKFLLSREICGKANLIYSVYRLPLCRRAAAEVGFADCWGADMAFVLAAIARGGILIDSRVLFQKRLSPNETIDTMADRKIGQRYSGIFPLEHFQAYKRELIRAVRGTPFVRLTNALMNYRFYRARLSRLIGT